MTGNGGSGRVQCRLELAVNVEVAVTDGAKGHGQLEVAALVMLDVF